MFVRVRPDSYAELVNNIFVQDARVHCSGTVSIRYNDFWITSTVCPLGVGNISADPLPCSVPYWPTPWLQPGSPCIGTGENGANMGAGGVCGVTNVGEPASSGRLRLAMGPNPVTSHAEIIIDHATDSPILEIFDPKGRLIDLLHPPSHRIRWSPPASLPRGVYFARLRGSGVSETVKFLLIR